MSTSELLSSPPDCSTLHVAHAVSRDLESAFAKACKRHYEQEVTIHRLDAGEVEPRSDEASEEVHVAVRLDAPAITLIQSRLVVTYFGGNVYELCCDLDEGASRRWSFGLPEGTAHPTDGPADLSTGTSLPCTEAAQFLRQTLEMRLGRLLLQSSAPPTAFEAHLPEC